MVQILASGKKEEVFLDNVLVTKTVPTRLCDKLKKIIYNENIVLIESCWNKDKTYSFKASVSKNYLDKFENEIRSYKVDCLLDKYRNSRMKPYHWNNY